MAEPEIDTTTPHAARRYNYWLGGKDNFAVDRASGDAIAAVFPNVVTAARENLRFLRRAVRYLAGKCGVRQFLDIGTGLPVEPHVHDIAAQCAGVEGVRVVYVDNDPMVLVHARSLKNPQPPSAAAYIDGDLRDPDTIVKDPVLSELLDLGQPVGVLIVAVTHFLPDYLANPHEAVGQIMATMPTGSYLALSQVTYDDEPSEQVDKLRTLTRSGQHGPFQARSRADVARFFHGLELVDPGVVRVTGWRADLEPHPLAPSDEAPIYAAVAQRI